MVTMAGSLLWAVLPVEVGSIEGLGVPSMEVVMKSLVVVEMPVLQFAACTGEGV